MTHEPTTPSDPFESPRSTAVTEWCVLLGVVAVIFGWQLATATASMISVVISTGFYVVPVAVLYVMWRHDAQLTRREAARRADPTAFRAHFEPAFCLRCGESLKGQPRQGDCPACGTRFQRMLVSRG